MVRIVAIGTLVVVLAACGTNTRDAEPRAAAATTDAAVALTDAAPIDAAAAAALPDGCGEALRALAAEIAAMQRAKVPRGPRGKAVAAWQAIAAPCRRGAWYLAAAQLARGGARPLIAGGVTIASADQALVAGLAANDDRGVLVLTAYVAGLGGKPTLPRDACGRVTRIASDAPDAADQRAYVCGHAAFAAGDLDDAFTHFTAIGARYPDLPLRLAQLEGKLGHPTRVVTLDDGAARDFGATAGELAALRAAAKALR